MNIVTLIPYTGTVAGVVFGTYGIRMAKRRDKDAVMTQQNKDIREIMVDMGVVKATLAHKPTTVEMMTAINDAKSEIIHAVKNERKPS